MRKPKLLIADSNEDFRLALEQILQPQYHVFTCQDGKTALHLLRRENPDILVLDPTLPQLDGISLLHEALQENLHPMVLLVTCFLSSYILDTAAALGVGYILQKPCDIRATAERIRDLNSRLHIQARDPRNEICQILLKLNFSTKHDGFHYLADAIAMMTETAGQPVTKLIYPAIAEQYGCTPENVERSIRNAVNVAWKRKDSPLWPELFPSSQERRPSNSDFINRIAISLSVQPPMV